MITLLPPSYSPQEEALADAIDYGINPRVIRGFKFTPTDRVLPWLIWEYELGKILAWVPDPRQAIQDGVQFQRIRGTPASLRMTLKWMNIENFILKKNRQANTLLSFRLVFMICRMISLLIM